MKKNLLSLCLSLALTLGTPLVVNADTPANVSIAPAISASTLQSLPWQPLMPPVSQDIKLDNVSPQINQGDIQGAIAAYTLPADRGSLEVTLSSISKNNSLYAPSVLVLDEHLRPAAYYPSSYFPYQPPGAMSSDRLKGTAEQGSGNIMIGMLQPAPAATPVVVGSTAAVAAAPAPAPTQPAEPMLNDTEAYFNNGIKQAVKAGDIDKALKLMNEAEKLGSTTARETFIGSVKGKG